MNLEIVLAAIYGLVLGSFLNVCVYRMPLDLAIWKPARSFCPKCLGTIAWYDNIPVLSFLLLGAKCRRCGSKISWRYPAVELLTALAFAWAIAKHGATGEGYKLCGYAFLMIGCMFSDLEERILPDEFTLGGTWIGLALACVVALPQPLILPILLWQAKLPPMFVNLLESALGAALPTFIFWLVGEVYLRMRGREGLGFGDVKMVAMMGAFYGLGPALIGIAIGSVIASVAGVIFITLKRKDASSYELPFGTFLGLGGLIQQFLLR